MLCCWGYNFFPCCLFQKTLSIFQTISHTIWFQFVGCHSLGWDKAKTRASFGLESWLKAEQPCGVVSSVTVTQTPFFPECTAHWRPCCLQPRGLKSSDWHILLWFFFFCYDDSSVCDRKSRYTGLVHLGWSNRMLTDKKPRWPTYNAHLFDQNFRIISSRKNFVLKSWGARCLCNTLTKFVFDTNISTETCQCLCSCSGPKLFQQNHSCLAYRWQQRNIYSVSCS